MIKQTRTRSIRNILLFALAVALAGWIGFGIKSLTGSTSPLQNLGMLVFLVLPPLAGLLLRAFGGDGWSDIGWRPGLRGNLAGYAIALFIFPVIIGLLLLAGVLAGSTTLAGFATQGFGAFLAAVGMVFLSDFFKNIFEEFSWRGYLTPRLQALGLPDLANHLLTGLVWASWHVPYWLFLLDRSTLKNFTSQSFAVFLPLSILNIVTSAILYGEVRLLTNSTWATVLLHTSANAVSLALLLNGFVKIDPAAEIWFTPGGFGIIGIALVTLAGLGLYLYRMKKQGKK